jgi:mono/diheme cytochrome c family protein
MIPQFSSGRRELMVSLTRYATGVIVIAGTLAATFLTVEAQQSVDRGVFTERQAQRGQVIYREQCASCHGDALEGRLGPPLAGEGFVRVWNKEPLSQLAAKIRNTMPQAAPGTLSAQQTADILAYMLQAGKFPAGQAELSGDEAVLKQVLWPATGVAQTSPADTSQAPQFPPAGNLAQVMRGILFPASNIIFTTQTVDPGAAPKPTVDDVTAGGGFNWAVWGGAIYKGWDMVDYAAIALAESAPLMLTPGRRCENGQPVPIDDPEWIKFTMELAEAGKAAYKASQTRNQQTISDVTAQVSDSCQHCHSVYRDRRRGATKCVK